jgi:glyoxylase-like metal-dependent hydrolase (beta-lactamase superfamily II)
MREVATGVWHWEARHPDWTEEAGGWGPEVSSYAIDDGRRLLLFDPLDVPAELEALAAERETAIVLTCTWHARDAVALSERLGVPLYSPPVDEGEPALPAETFVAGERLPVGVEAFAGMEPNDLVLWVESRRALVLGDSLIDRGDGLEFPRDWAETGAIADRGVPADEILASLQPLRELRVELVLPAHGAPTDRAALVRALDETA